METDFQQNKLQEMLRNKWLVGAVLGGIVVILILVVGGTRPKPGLPGATQTTNTNTGTASEQTVDPTKSPELLQAISEQQKTDNAHVEDTTQRIDDYSWNKYFPLATEKYYVYFDLNQKVFLGRLYTTPADDPKQMKADLLAQMKGKEIPTDQYPFEWTVIPQ